MNLLIKNCLAITLLTVGLTACDKKDVSIENASEKLGSAVEGTTEGMKNVSAKAGELVDATVNQLENAQAKVESLAEATGDQLQSSKEKAGDMVEAAGDKMENSQVALKESALDAEQDMEAMKNNMADKMDTACNEITKENC